MLERVLQRPRRLRKSRSIRNLVAETQLSLENFIQPYFLEPKPSAKEEIKNFKDVYRWGVDSLSREIENQLDRGLSRFLLFGGAEKKDPAASEAVSAEGYFVKGIATLKERFGHEALLFSDVCLCPYSSDGHCGVIHEGDIKNDASVDLLAQMALRHAEAGVDYVAPSDMMDGRVGAIRALLDQKGFSDTGILAYTAKYRSQYYGPFREALDSSPKEGNRSSYQMDYRNAREALRELELDETEGADLVMVKPALAYLDIIYRLSQKSHLPIAAYSVSSEYQMVQMAVESGIADEKDLVLENLTAIRRAGAQIIVTYHASKIVEKGWLK